MKRTITLILCLLMLLTLFSACTTDVGKSDNATDPPGQSGTPTGEITGTQSGGSSANTDGSIDLAVKPGEANGFICSSKEGGAFVVNLPEGAFGSDTQLSVSRVTTTLDGIVIPGFTVTDTANPGAHVALSEPAAITLFSKEALPRDITIVKYSDDMTYCEAVPSIVIETDFGCFIMAEVDGFSSYGAGKAGKSGGGTGDIDSLVWRIEAESHDIREMQKGEGYIAVCDADFLLRTDSIRVPVSNNNLAIPRTYNGLFDVVFQYVTHSTSYSTPDIKDVDPYVLEFGGWHLYDNNLKLTMMPKIKEASTEEWEDYYDKLVDWLDTMGISELLVPLVPREERLVPLIPKPKPPKDIFDGYIGWGTAYLMSDHAELNAYLQLPRAVPLIVRVKGVEVTVSFKFPYYLGDVEMKGTYKGVGVTEAAVLPALKDPMALKDEFYAKPDNPPSPITGDPIGEVRESAASGNTKIELSGGGWISIVQLFEEDEEDEEDSIDDFITLWNAPLAVKLWNDN